MAHETKITRKRGTQLMAKSLCLWPTGLAVIPPAVNITPSRWQDELIFGLSLT